MRIKDRSMDKPQFDQYLGGEVTLPRDVEIIKLVTARASEICAMTQCLENPRSTKLIFQKLPMHMRRRVMSHNTKRMPRRLRMAHLSQMKKSGLPPRNKRPSRKYRRRPGNLLAEYNRRQRQKIWLESHIWHAKRFHMIEKWGYKIANFSNDRGFRASYRAVAKHCMIQDISFYRCIELTGPQLILIETLRNHCRNELSFGAKTYLSGTREGSLTFFKKDKNPLGVVNFLWKPTEAETRSIWIWVHPAFYKDVLDELISSFEFTEILTTLPDVESIPESLINKSYNNKTGCKMELLTFSLNRFRLRGPLAISVLNDALRLPDLRQSHQEFTTSDVNDMEIDANKCWEYDWYHNPEHRKSFDAQEKFFHHFQEINATNQLPCHSIVGFTVLDPRFYLPKKREKSVPSSILSKSIDRLDSFVSDSPLWNANVRNVIKENFKTTSEISKLRSGNLVPGVDNDGDFEQEVISKIPIILIQYPGNNSDDKSIGFNSGMDIILPAGWALAVWLSFILRCARPIGIREYRSTLFESLMLNTSDIRHPDTRAYKNEAKDIKKEFTEKYFRYPPNKRVNYTKFAVSSPFFCEWKILVKEWTNQETVNVLRDRLTYSILISTFKSLSSPKSRNKKSKNQSDSDLNLDEFLKTVDKSLLVPVKITVDRQGKPNDFALICMPLNEDLKKIDVDKKYNGPTQESRPDPFESERKILRKKHKILLKQLTRKRIKARKKEMNNGYIQKLETASMKEEYSRKMRNLWLPDCREVRRSCDREVMGYIVQGDFSFTESKGVGWGYVVMQTLVDLIKKGSNYVLIRNTKTKHYRIARIEIINLYS